MAGTRVVAALVALVAAITAAVITSAVMLVGGAAVARRFAEEKDGRCSPDTTDGCAQLPSLGWWWSVAAALTLVAAVAVVLWFVADRRSRHRERERQYDA